MTLVTMRPRRALQYCFSDESCSLGGDHDATADDDDDAEVLLILTMVVSVAMWTVRSLRKVVM